VGTAPVLVHQSRRVTAVARTDVELLRVPGDELRTLLGRRPEWVRELARDVVSYLDLAMQGAADLLIRDPAARCAAVLLRLGGRRWAAPPDADLPTEIPASQGELAMLCNVSRNTFGRVVGKFAARRLVEIRYRSLTIVDPPALRGIADGG
jgi:CRP-like cAMP-binding protein